MIEFAQLTHEAFMVAFAVGVLTGLIAAMVHWYYI